MHSMLVGLNFWCLLRCQDTSSHRERCQQQSAVCFADLALSGGPSSKSVRTHIGLKQESFPTNARGVLYFLRRLNGDGHNAFSNFVYYNLVTDINIRI